MFTAKSHSWLGCDKSRTASAMFSGRITLVGNRYPAAQENLQPVEDSMPGSNFVGEHM